MAWPPTLPPATRTNDSGLHDDHPDDHNKLASGMADVVTKVNGIASDLDALELAVAGGAVQVLSLQVDKYETAGTFTWTKPAGAVFIEVHLIGAGGGGGAGRRGAAGTLRGGGGGGGGGSYQRYSFDPSAFGATASVTVGAGGTGGAAQTANDTDGANGNAGGATSVVCLLGTLQQLATSGGGAGGKASTSAGGTGYTGTHFQGGPGGSGNPTIGGIVGSTQYHPGTAGGGGGGGGIDTANTSFPGAVANGHNWLVGSASTAIGADGAAGSLVNLAGGIGGGGGNVASNGGKGGNPGGGGGGGGASLNGANSGAGGAGGDGAVMIRTWKTA